MKKRDKGFERVADYRDNFRVAGLRGTELQRLIAILRRTEISLIDGLVELGVSTGYLTADSLDAIREKLNEWYDFSQHPETQKWNYGNC